MVINAGSPGADGWESGNLGSPDPDELTVIERTAPGGDAAEQVWPVT